MRSRRWRGLIAVMGAAMLIGATGGAWAQRTNPDAAAVEANAEKLDAEVFKLHAAGKYDEAIGLAKQVLAVREITHGKEHVLVATSLHNLAVLYADQGDYALAEPLYHRALGILEKAVGPNHAVVASVLTGLALLYADKAEYARAEPLHQRALAIREKSFGPDHPKVASALVNLAIIYRTKGDYARAEPLFQRSLAMREKVLGPDHLDVAHSLNGLALLYSAKGDYARALPLCQRALGIREKALGPDHLDVAESLNNLALLYKEKGDYARAEPLYQRVLAIYEKALRPDHPSVATLLYNLASLYHEKGDYARAEPLYERALGIWKKLLGPDHPHVGVALGSISVLLATQNRLDKAIDAAQRATDIGDRNALAQLSTGSEEQKRLYMNRLVGETHYDISLHILHAPMNTDAARLAFTALLRRKGRVLETMTDSLTILRQSLTPSDQEVADQLARVYSQLATHLTRGPRDNSPEEYRKKIAALEVKRQKFEADIGTRSASFRIEKRLVTIDDVQGALPKNAALLELARYEPVALRNEAEPHSKSKPRYAAYVLGANGNLVFADLGEAEPLEAAIETLRRALSDPDLSHDPKPAARALDRLLMEPIRKLIGDTRWVFVSADGPTHLVPFAALVDENGHYLVENYLFSYVNTGRDLLRFAEKPRSSREAPLVLANPAFDDSSAPPVPEARHRGVRSIDMVMQRLLPLGGTAEEAQTIHTLFPESRILTGTKATEETLKAAHAPRFLHLATHGFFLPEQPVPEELLHNRGSEPTPAERAAILQRENPLLRSGIALAGFNQRKSGIDDGVLTALEVTGLDLHGTHLVVLSACETGVGQTSSGEGVYGLRRALSMAGAETQVMSLWQVDTGRTRELMQGYYGRLKEKRGRSESMRNVQLAMLSNPDTSHPNLWASFIVSGDWRALEDDAIAPDLTVHPGSHGCACEYAGDETTSNAAIWFSIGLGLARKLRLRRTAPTLSQ